MKTYFFDVTDILIYVERETSVSGIQRVSFEVIKRMVNRHGTEAVRISYWDRSQREYVSMPSDFIAEMNEFDTDVLSAIFFGSKARPRQDTAPTLERYRNRPLKYRFHYLRRRWHEARGNEAHFEKHHSSIDEWRAFRSGGLPAPEPVQTHEIKRTPVTAIAEPGDKLVVLGATWSIDGIDEIFQKLHDQYDLQISQLIYDLIPIITPEHIAGDFALEFYRWLKASTGYCTSYFTISESTSRDLASFLEEIGVDRPVTTVPLAQELTIVEPRKTFRLKGPEGSFKARAERSTTIRREILNLSKTPFVLVVGTMESRKNIWRLALAWQRLSQEPELNLPKLVFAGKPGWYNEDFNQLMRGTGNLGGWVQIADRPTDTELAWLYETCVFTAMVSLYEGWGLPIGEGLGFGKTAVVADNSSMPEVGGDLVEYCDANSITSIADACRRLIADPDHRRALEEKIAKADLRGWDDVAADYVEALAAGA
jgi:glycosyltransferase involved in cell wall biosynthesis